MFTHTHGSVLIEVLLCTEAWIKLKQLIRMVNNLF